uniref:PiggyBac transposable element-derived protein 4 n=1 Tax=Bactrocera latifrons TaxID=174628 RepID=A0A0K8UXT0_BACLA
MEHSNISQDPHCSKRTSSGTFKNRNELILQWLEKESEHEFSDMDDECNDPNFQPETALLDNDEDNEEQHATTSETQNICEEVNQHPTSDYYKGKKGFMWSARERPKTSRTASHNIIRLPGRLQTSTFEGYLQLWSKIFDESMLECLVQYTNQKLCNYRAKFNNTTKVELMDTYVTEMKAFIGLLYYTSVFKCNDADLRTIFATDGSGREIFRCGMSNFRFSSLVNCLRFDDSTTRAERLKEDQLAPISNFFNKFILNSQFQYTPGPYLCIDEMLLPFKGRCKFKIYMPQKPAQYGIKIMLLVDARTYYIYNAYIYHGKNSDGIGLNEQERKLAALTQSVVRLVKVVENSKRNITADNWFSYIPLMEALLKERLTYIGTLKKNKVEIPSSFLPCKTREVGSSMYGFTKEYTLLSYVPKKIKLFC